MVVFVPSILRFIINLLSLWFQSPILEGFSRLNTSFPFSHTGLSHPKTIRNVIIINK